MILTDDLCSKEQTERLYHAGCPLEKVYRQDGRMLWYSLPVSDSRWQDCDAYFIPTLAQVAKWLRYEKHLSIEPYRTAAGYLYFIAHAESGRDLAHVMDGGDDAFSGNFTTYEKALSHAIDTALDMLDSVNGNNKK